MDFNFIYLFLRDNKFRSISVRHQIITEGGQEDWNTNKVHFESYGASISLSQDRERITRAVLSPSCPLSALRTPATVQAPGSSSVPGDAPVSLLLHLQSCRGSNPDNWELSGQRCKYLKTCTQCLFKKTLSQVNSLQNFTLFCRESE